MRRHSLSSPSLSISLSTSIFLMIEKQFLFKSTNNKSWFLNLIDFLHSLSLFFTQLSHFRVFSFLSICFSMFFFVLHLFALCFSTITIYCSVLCLHRAVCRLSLAIVDLLYDFSTVVAVRLRSTTYMFYVNFSSVQRSSSIPSPSGCKFFISYFF